MNFDRDVARLDWEYIERQLDEEGYSVLPRFLSQRVADDLRHLANAYKIQSAVEDGFGSGRLSCLPRDLPPVLWEMRQAFYLRLAWVANRWNKDLGVRRGSLLPCRGLLPGREPPCDNGQGQAALMRKIAEGPEVRYGDS